MVETPKEIGHTEYVPNNPEAIQLQLKYLTAVADAFFRLGAEIAKTACTCEETSYHCSRCKMVEVFAGLRRELTKLKQENTEHGKS